MTSYDACKVDTIVEKVGIIEASNERIETDINCTMSYTSDALSLIRVYAIRTDLDNPALGDEYIYLTFI